MNTEPPTLDPARGLPPYKFNRKRPSEVARLRRLLTLLAEHVGVDLADLEARDEARRRGHPSTWRECEVIGVDPRTGKQVTR